jgi:hypothetical protein
MAKPEQTEVEMPRLRILTQWLLLLKASECKDCEFYTKNHGECQLFFHENSRRDPAAGAMGKYS